MTVESEWRLAVLDVIRMTEHQHGETKRLLERQLNRLLPPLFGDLTRVDWLRTSSWPMAEALIRQALEANHSPADAVTGPARSLRGSSSPLRP